MSAKKVKGLEPGTVYLTAKQSRFIEEYLIDFNAEQAAVRAGYSKKSASFIGFENINKPYLKIAIQKRMDEMTAKTQDKVLWVLQELRGIAVRKDDNLLKHKTKALELMGRYYSMFSDKIDITTNGQALAPINVTFTEVQPPADSDSMEEPTP